MQFSISSMCCSTHQGLDRGEGVNWDGKEGANLGSEIRILKKEDWPAFAKEGANLDSEIRNEKKEDWSVKQISIPIPIPEDNDHLHNEEESGNDDIGEVPGQEGEQEGGQDAVLCAHAGGCYCYCFCYCYFDDHDHS